MKDEKVKSKEWIKKKRKAERTLFKDVKKMSWRKRKAEKKPYREKALLNQLKQHEEEEQKKQTKGDVTTEEHVLDKNQSQTYSLSIALPGSILNNAQSAELRSHLAGQIARAATVFCVDEIVIYDENARMSPQERESYYKQSWHAYLPIRNENVECNFHMAKILEFLECPQYLRKTLFPLHKSLKYAGLLNPLDCTHHLRTYDLNLPYREGVVLEKPVKAGRGPLCDVGLKKECQIDSEIDLPAGVRVSLKIKNIHTEQKKYHGEITSAKRIRNESGLYWGYNVRIALSLRDALYGQTYDHIIGTSERGIPIRDYKVPTVPNSRFLLVFGGLDGLEAAIEADESIDCSKPEELFENYINVVPEQGCRTIRTEEAVLITLAVMKPLLDSHL